ncbi:MAG: hypothetical protein QM538_07240 [Methylacidiphilales bacterium]|nr:hypothetical protein [Candidatus Methylacidiphilales bacterium]
MNSHQSIIIYCSTTTAWVIPSIGTAQEYQSWSVLPTPEVIIAVCEKIIQDNPNETTYRLICAPPLIAQYGYHFEKSVELKTIINDFKQSGFLCERERDIVTLKDPQQSYLATYGIPSELQNAIQNKLIGVQSLLPLAQVLLNVVQKTQPTNHPFGLLVRTQYADWYYLCVHEVAIPFHPPILPAQRSSLDWPTILGQTECAQDVPIITFEENSSETLQSLHSLIQNPLTSLAVYGDALQKYAKRSTREIVLAAISLVLSVSVLTFSATALQNETVPTTMTIPVEKINEYNTIARALNISFVDMLDAVDPPKQLELSLVSLQVLNVRSDTLRPTIRLAFFCKNINTMSRYLTYLYEQKDLTNSKLISNQKVSKDSLRGLEFIVETTWHGNN